MLDIEVDLLRRTWFPVARLQDVRPGPARARLLGEELVVYDGPNGVTVAHGWCPHRQTMLSRGRVVDGHLECPYHGWQFESGTGTLKHIPSLAPGIPMTRCAVATYPVHLAYGLVWSVLDEPYLPPAELRGLPTDWELVPDGDPVHYRAGAFEIAWSEVDEVHAGMRALHENFRDMSHFAFVHRNSMGPNVGRVIPDYRVKRDGWNLDYTLVSTPEQDGSVSEVASVTLGRTNDYTIYLPSFTTIYSHSSQGGTRFVTQLVTPAETDGVHVRNFFGAGLDGEMRELHGLNLKETFAFDCLITREDYPPVEATFPKEQPLTTKRQAHTRADAYSIAYRKHYRQLLGEFARDFGYPDPFVAEDGELVPA